ncbi:MAG: glycosyltransferase [Kiritimatiellaeota bacterium]|nr:glycosyltransferase [Kiritimatiellota bacterium]
MNASPRILVMAPDLPFPIRAGGQMRMASFVKALARVGRVHVACVARELPGETLNWCTELGVSITHLPRARVSPGRLWGERLEMILTCSNLLKRPGEQAFFEEEFRRFKPNLVWLETPYLSRYALVWEGRLPIVVNYWGTSQGAERDFRAARGSRKIWEWFRWRAAKGGEVKFAPRLSAIVTVSELDANWFRQLAPKAPVTAIPNGILQQSERDYSQVPEDPELMVFTGDLGYRPNVDAVTWFVREIFPRIRTAQPTARFKAAGRTPTEDVRALAELDGIEITGFVPDLGEIIAGAALYVLPMRLGSGIRSKLFDVFPLGKAIVTTAVGAEGLELHDGRNCRIADTPAEFAAACAELLKNPDKRRRLGMTLKRLSTEVYSQERVETAVAELVRRVLEVRED